MLSGSTPVSFAVKFPFESFEIVITASVVIPLSAASTSTAFLSSSTFCKSVDCLDLSTYLINCGASTPTSTAIIAITTISSTREKPLLFFCFFLNVFSTFFTIVHFSFSFKNLVFFKVLCPIYTALCFDRKIVPLFFKKCKRKIGH